MSHANETHTPRRKRASRRMVRLWAWTAGALSFLAPWALLGHWPKPAPVAAAAAAPAKATRPRRPVVVVVTKKIVYTDSPTSSVSTTGGGSVHYVYAPSTTPVATSCGSPPC
jgi:hypothetical protein